MNRILIVEDDEAIAQLESDYLHAQGFEATVAPDGPTGLDKALTGDYALIILDVMLPGMDGFEVLSKVREQRNIPILLVTARKDDVDKIKGLGLGADDYITKPFSPSELAARVKAHIKRYDRLVGAVVPERDVIEIRDLKLDKTSRKLYVSGEEKKLTAREFDLTPSATSPRSRSTSKSCARKSRSTATTPSTLKPCGASATASAYRVRIM